MTKFETVDSVDIETAELTETANSYTIDVTGTDLLKVFVWNGFSSISPLLKNAGIISRKVYTPTVSVETADGVTTKAVTLTAAGVTAEAPAGVVMAEGATALTLSVAELENSESGIQVEENQQLNSLDVHIGGVSADNTTPIIITVLNAAEPGYNKGNLTLYHVENGEPVEMTEVEAVSDLTAHNQFTYDPATGDITLALSTFSEIALVSDTEQGWEGEIATGFSGGTGTEEDPYIIANADQMAYLSAVVGGMIGLKQDSFTDKYIKLIADINFDDGEEANDPDKIFYPVGYYNSEYIYEKTGVAITSSFMPFEGTFDGNGHTIKNIYQNTWEMKGDHEWYDASEQYYRDGMGIFGKLIGATVKNLTVDNFKSDGEITTTGVIATYADSAEGRPAIFENIAITNCNPRVYNIGNGGIVGSGGWYSRETDLSDNENANAIIFRNITVDNTNKISALWGSWDVACSGIMGRYYPDSNCGVKFENCHVGAQIDVYNDVCGNYQYYWYRYAGMMIGTVQKSTTDKNGYTVPDLTGIKAENCTVHFGDWNNYWYCELVANSLASYTHDHQFSRLDIISSLDEIKSGEAWLKAGNFLLIDGDTKTCYHIMKSSEGNLYQHFHDKADESNPNIYETDIDEDGDGNVDLKEDKQRVYLPFNQLFQGSGWGVKHIPTGEFDGITILDRKVADSKVKFEKADTAKEKYTTGTTVTVGELFKAAEINDEKLAIKPENVQVTVSPVEEGTDVSAVYKANSSDWTQGTLEFSGIGDLTVTITDYYFCTPTTITVTVADLEPVDKFEAKSDLTFVHTEEGGTISKTLGDIFTAIEGVTIDSANVEVTLSGADICTYTKNDSDWTQSTLAFTGTGNVTVTITDKNYCKEASATVTITEPEAVKKFTAKDGEYTLEIGETSHKVTLGDLFDEISNTDIYTGKITATVNSDEIDVDDSDWTKSEVVFDAPGSYSITITDNNFCTPTTASFTVNEPVPVDKFKAQTDLSFEFETKNVAVVKTLGEIFTTTGDYDEHIKNSTVKVTATNDVTYAADKENWKNGTLTFPNNGGTLTTTITITDDYYCKVASADVTVKEPVAKDKFGLVFENTGKYLYRVGNNGLDSETYDVTLGHLFKAISGADIGDVSITVEPVGTSSVTYVYTPDSKWTSGTIDFEGTGLVRITIDDNKYANPLVLIVEVVDAVNTTTATSATANNVVLLNDIGSGFTVSGNYTFYGNGFTLNYTGNGQYLNNGLKQGLITVNENGTLDNLRVVAGIYPAAYLYYGSTTMGDYVQGGPSTTEGDKTRYYYQLSAIAASGNATISNCYVYGGRNNIFVNTGDVTVKDSVLECGTVANVQIQSNASHTITFENVTTIQHLVNPTMGDTSLKMLGFGVLVGPETNDNPKIVLNGEFKQYNWVNVDDANAVSDTKITKPIIQGALDATDYNHTINGKTASNLGIIYINEYDAKVENNTGLPYVLDTITLSMGANSVDGQAYSLQNATAEQIYSDYANADKSTENGVYEPQFKYSADLGGQYIEKDSGDEHCYREGDTIYVLFPSGDTKELDLAALVDITKYTGQDLSTVITCKDNSGNAVEITDGKISLTDAGEYTVTYTVTDNLFYDKDGKTVDDSKEYSWDVTVSVSLKDTSVPNAYFDYDTTKQTMGYAKKSVFAGGNTQYIPFLAGLKIYDYNGQTSYLRFDGDNDFNKIASATITSYTSANHVLIEVKLTDGGVINIDTTARAASGGSTYTGKLQTNGNTLYYVNDGTTSATTTTWVISNYSFVGNNGVTIDSGSVTFANCENGSVPTGSFSTTINYTVDYDANGGNCGQTVGYATSASDAVTLPTPTRSGYIFAGWYTATTGGTKAGNAGTNYTPSADITLYAQWLAPFAVTYNANGGSCDTASATYSGTALVLPTATRDGYWFSGWFDASSGGNKVGDAGASYNPEGATTLYAQWQEQISYTVTYNANGGNCDTASATYEGSALTLPTPTKDHSNFKGWYTAASSGTKAGDAGAPYTPSSDITLYAQWEDWVSYTITVTTSNATVTGVTNGQTAYAGDTISVTVSFSKDNSKTLTVTDGSDNTLLSKSAAGTYTFTMPASNVTIDASSSSSSICVTPDTLVTMADGSKKAIKDVAVGEEVIAWNFHTGSYEAVPASLSQSDGSGELDVLSLKFSDGTVLKVLGEHGIFDADLNNFIFIDIDDVENYIGHSFVQKDDDGYKTVKLVNYEITTENTEAYTILSAYYHNVILEDMLTVSPAHVGDNFFNPFEIHEGLKYNEASVKADIEKYGLYTYEEFAHVLTREQFDVLNIAQFKVSAGKGLVTYEGLIYLIENFINR